MRLVVRAAVVLAVFVVIALTISHAVMAHELASGDTPEQRNAVYREKTLAFVSERGFFAVLGDQLGRQYFRLFSAKTPLVSQLPGPACAGHLSVYSTSAWLTLTATSTIASRHRARSLPPWAHSLPSR